jgi:hypothetical protein
MNLKISVLSSGSVLLDGEPAGLDNLAEAIQKAEPTTDCVLYYRENAAAEPPAVSGEVMNLVIAKKLPVSFSTKPDFSDYVDALGRTGPREEAGSPPHPNSVFAKARQAGVTIVTPSRQLSAIPLPPASKKLEAMTKTLPKIFASEGPHNIAVIADTGFAEGRNILPIEEAARAIPFLGFLVGFTLAGHKVWIFDGAASSLEAGLAESDALLVDSVMLPSLRPDWMQIARKAMRPDARFFLHDREPYRLRRVVPSGFAPGWRDCEPEGERSYANCLLTTLATGSVASVVLSSESPLPDLAGLTQDPEELDWIASLPFRYDQLDFAQVLGNLVAFSGGAVNWARQEWTFSPVLASAKGNSKPVFVFRWRSRLRKQILEITRK